MDRKWSQGSRRGFVHVCVRSELFLKNMQSNFDQTRWICLIPCLVSAKDKWNCSNRIQDGCQKVCKNRHFHHSGSPINTRTRPNFSGFPSDWHQQILTSSITAIFRPSVSRMVAKMFTKYDTFMLVNAMTRPNFIVFPSDWHQQVLWMSRISFFNLLFPRWPPNMTHLCL